MGVGNEDIPSFPIFSEILVSSWPWDDSKLPVLESIIQAPISQPIHSIVWYITGIFTYMWANLYGKLVGKYTVPYIDPMGKNYPQKSTEFLYPWDPITFWEW